MATKVSLAQGEYLRERLRVASVFMFVHTAVPIMASLANLTPDIFKHVKDIETDTRRVWDKFTSDLTPEEFHAFCDEVWHCRNVDAFQRYLEQMLFEVFTQRPETLRSSEQIKISDLLSYGNMDDVVRRLAERKVASLAYQGFDELVRYLTEKLGLPVDPNATDIAAVREGMEVRNIVVHNSCVINDVFLRRTNRTDLSQGARFPLDQGYVIENGTCARRLVEELDAAFVAHFRLAVDGNHGKIPAAAEVREDG